MDFLRLKRHISLLLFDGATLNITVARCFAWKNAGEFDIRINMTGYRTGYVFITASNLLFFNIEEPPNIKPLYNAFRSLTERRISLVSVLVKYMVKNLHITRPWYSEHILPALQPFVTLSFHCSKDVLL